MTFFYVSHVCWRDQVDAIQGLNCFSLELSEVNDQPSSVSFDAKFIPHTWQAHGFSFNGMEAETDLHGRNSLEKGQRACLGPEEKYASADNFIALKKKIPIYIVDSAQLS